MLAQPVLESPYRTGTPKLLLTADHMRALPEFFRDLPDPRRAQGRRHPLPTVLAIAAGAILCGMRGYKAIADWARSLGPKARERFRCRGKNGRYHVPSESIIRDVLIRVAHTHVQTHTILEKTSTYRIALEPHEAGIEYLNTLDDIAKLVQAKSDNR